MNCFMILCSKPTKSHQFLSFYFLQMLLGLTTEAIEDEFGITKDTPYFLNIASDEQLSGRRKNILTPKSDQNS